MGRKISPGARRIIKLDREIQVDPHFGFAERERPATRVRSGAEVLAGNLAWAIKAALIIGGPLALFENFTKHPVGDRYVSKEGIAVIVGSLRLAYGLINPAKD
jgi:hypothetical protein